MNADTSKVEELIRKLSGFAEETVNKQKQLKGMISNMQSSWNDAHYNALVQQFQEFDKKISEFFKANNQNIKLINDKIGKDPSRKCLEIILKNLQEQDPEKFENLIEFEINKIELKMELII